MVISAELYPFGTENGDKNLPSGDIKTRKVIIKTGFPVGSGLQRDVFVAIKGLVSFGKRNSGKRLKLKTDQMMVCPYLTDIRGNTTVGRIFYQLHTDNPLVLNKATAEVREFTDLKNFQASLVLVATWHRVQHHNSRNADEEATVQLALTSNGKRSFALVFYQKNAMKWSFLPEEPLVIGLATGDPNQAFTSVYSNTPQAFTSLDSIKGNTGREGMWIFDVGDSYSADQACQDWYTRNLALNTERQAGFERLPQCPCNWWFVWGNWRWSHYLSGYSVTCFRMTVGGSRSVAPHGKECCYKTDWHDWSTYGQYLSDAPHAGSATAFNPAFWSLRSQYQQEDRQAHDICCYNTTNSDYCRMYYELRPIGECTTRIPFRTSPTFGDPHIKTLDGREYTFNGLGEYTMITMTTPNVTFYLQGRTSLAETESGPVTNATVFTAFGAEENGVKIFVGLDSTTNTTMVIYASEVPDVSKDKDVTNRFKNEGDNFEEENEAYLLTNSNNSLVATFTSGIQLTVSVGFKSLDMSVTMPIEFQGQTRGLLGNFNGVKDDDFILPNGTTLPSTLTDREIYEMFGPEWAVTESNTVLRYPPREGPADYAHPEFTPIFLDEQPDDVRQAAEELCGATNLACVYDYVATGSAAIANATRNTADTADRIETVIKNTVPLLTFNDTLIVTAGQALQFNLQGHDPDVGDNLTYHMVGEPDERVQLNSATGDVTVSMNSSSPRSLSFYAKDSKDVQSPLREIVVILCPHCSGHGICDVNHTVSSDGTEIGSCVCEPAWTGPDCSEDFDACEDNPCSVHQECVDLTPEQQGNSETGFTCTACAGGFEDDPDDPTRCVDIDECQLPGINCSVTCTNLPGSYQCGCHAGYRLNLDGVTCDDINECADRTAGCQQECFNTDGSYYCECYSGYTLGDKGICEPDANTSDACSAAGCAQGCVIENEASNSTIASCFCNVGYVRDPNNSSACVDVDECEEGFCSQGCTNTEGSFACTCYTGYVLDSDQRTCSPCEGLRYGPECRMTCTCNGHAARCDPVTGCVCTSGWTGSQCERDVDECVENPDVCDKGQTCSNTNGSYVCNCPPGYIKNADDSCVDVNECAEGSPLNTCGELEDCINVPGSFYCACTEVGYTRSNGECIDIDECVSGIHECQHICQNVQGSYNCMCHYGFRLDHLRTGCVQVKDVCAEFEGLDCDHGCTLDDNDRGVCYCNASYTLAPDLQSCLDEDKCRTGTAGCSHTCTNTPGGFTCSCPVGKTLDNDGKTCTDCPSGMWGEDCSQDCACSVGATGCDAVTGCQCMPGWTGETCEEDVNECDTESAQLECQARNAQCLNFQGGYRCQCQPGYQEDDVGNCEDIDECTGNVCGQLCENSPGSYRCLCYKGFTLDATTGQCNDIDECALSVSNNCTQRCINTLGGYRCACISEDFVLQNDGFTCVATSTCNRTDCPTENGGCSQEQCYCNSGYDLSSDEATCDRIVTDWCAVSGCDQTCQLTDDGASFACGCSDGYLLNDDSKTCRECPEGTYGAGCGSVCGCHVHNTASCDIMNGTCICRSGWQGVSCDVDIDECTISSVTCPPNSQCVNTMGDYLCSCNPGYYKTTNDTCTECSRNTFGENCAQRCNCVNAETCDNVNGSCSCKAGWTGTRCDSDIDECSTAANPCSGNNAVCKNTEGSFQCECLPGYQFDDSGNCVDIDWCAISGCNQTCQETANGTWFICGCNDGYQLNTDGKTCSVCPDNSYGQNCAETCMCRVDTTVSCNKVNGTCTCKEGWTGSGCDSDIDECLTGTHDCEGHLVICINTAGGYLCDCEQGYTFNASGSCVDVDECHSSTTNDCAQKCENTDGGYTCTCNSGFVAEGNDCREITTVSLTMTIDISVVESDLADPNSQTYQNWVLLLTETLDGLIRPSVAGLEEIIVRSLRLGSLIVQAEVIVDEVSDGNAVPDLSATLLTLTQKQISVGSQTGGVKIDVNGITVDTSDTACQVYEAIRPCESGHECHVTEGLPTCKEIGSGGGDNLTLIIGLAVSIPVVLLLVVVVAVCLHKKHHKKARKTRPSLVVPQGPFHGGQKSPYTNLAHRSSSTSSVSTSSGKRSWTDNM